MNPSEGVLSDHIHYQVVRDGGSRVLGDGSPTFHTKVLD